MIVAHFALPTVRHQDETFKLRLFNTANTKVAEFDVPDPDPSAGKYPQWQPEEVPVTKAEGDVSVALTALTARARESTYTGPDRIRRTRTRIWVTPWLRQ